MNWLNTYGIHFPQWEEKDHPPDRLWDEELWRKALLDFGRLYVAETPGGTAAKGACPRDDECRFKPALIAAQKCLAEPSGAACGGGEIVSSPGTNDYAPPTPSATARRADNCIFFHTWQSLAVMSGITSQYIPVRLGKDWLDVVGGWSWGVVDNGAGKRRGAEIVRYACSGAMNSFFIDKMIGGIPPRKGLCHPTAVPSARNLGLMRGIVERRTWDRSRVYAYGRLSSVLSVMLHELLSSLDGFICSRPSHQDRMLFLEQWLSVALTGMLQGIRQSLGVSPVARRNDAQRKN